ncbi:MAG: hypothetical protein CVT92_15905 [Bacteroidetes bacterium HGW-Bacteroidetes-1]|jgi:two-component SAPR family response regulator|nr:MAG: hypothetical protein CVT92_15905 [Bacteroidetes bacterium HGW-Bacteroidetes-1]
MTLHVLIVEDEEATAQRMVSMLQQIEPTAVIAEMTDSIEATVKWMKENPLPDLMLLDIQLSDGSSFHIFEQVEVQYPVIFTTAYDQYALLAFKVNSIDYLLKPLKKSELEAALIK